jgi:hypothetical protein
MALKDIFKKKNKGLLYSELGQPGTEFFSGYISEEYNPDLLNKQGIELYDKMRKNDSQIYSTLQAVKLPLLQAQWFVEPAKGDDVNKEEAIEQAKFIEDLLINKLKWKKQLRLILTFLEFGFKYLEKVYSLDEKGRIVWSKWGDRQQTAHDKWMSDDNVIGASQQPTSPYRIEKGIFTPDTDNRMPFIPMEKLLLFSYQREGDNYEGISLLRAAYKHYWFKDTLYKIQGISCERYGVGMPWVQMGDFNSNDDRSNAENLAKNFRSNETSYLVTPGRKDDGGMNVEILTPGGDPKSADIREAIDHHNRMITMNILAPFLDLGSKNSGSYSLGESQLDFFLLGVKSIADIVIEVVDEAIEELILLNWPETKNFPKLNVTDLRDEDLEVFANSLNTLSMGNLLDVDEGLKAYIRKNLKLPELPDDWEEENNEDIEKEVIKEVKKEKTNKEAKKYADSKKKIQISEAEQIFMNAIDENEKIIDNNYLEFEKELKNTEKNIKDFLKKKYSKAKTKKINGVIKIKNSDKLFNDIKSGVNDIMKKFNSIVNGKTLSKDCLKRVAKLALITKDDINKAKKLSDDIFLSEGQIKSFLAGHISNISAFTYNESRRVLENAHDNIRQEVSLNLALKQVNEMEFNRNIYKLSVTAHPRGLFRNIIADTADKAGVKYYKMVVPKSKIGKLTPSGKTMAILFMILTAQQINQRTGTKNNVDTVGGLGGHHNSYEYAYPIDHYTEEEKELARLQRLEAVEMVEVLNKKDEK